MLLRIVAMATFAIASCLPAPARSQGVPQEILTLDGAFARVAQAHPDLRLFGAQTEVLRAERDQAALKPPVRAGLDIENVLGTGAAGGFDQGEITLSLAGVLERGGKLDARRALAQSRIDALSVQRESQRLDLLAETARRYLAIVGAQAQADIARRDIAQRKHTVAAARLRLQAGASPESVVLTAQAALAKAELGLQRALQQEGSAMRHLAALWGERNPAFRNAPVDPRMLPDIADLAALTRFLEDTPELARFADQQRTAEARLQLARSAARPDLDWQFGVRRLQETSDTALVASVSLPLGSERRAQPDIRAAEATLAMLEIEREAGGVALYATLVDAHGRYQGAQLEVERTARDVLPALSKAERAAERAYRAGATSYLEWAQLQSEQTATQRQQLEAALEAQRALIEIQRLTGQAFVIAADAQGITP